MTTARTATTPTTTRIASTGQSQGLDRLASMTSASYGLPERFNLRVPYVLQRTRPHRPLVSMPAEHIGLRVRFNGYRLRGMFRTHDQKGQRKIRHDASDRVASRP